MGAIRPFIYGINKCAKCGKENTLKYIDLRGEQHSQMIYNTSCAKCTECGTEYFIHWSDVDGTMKPYYSDKHIIDDFSKDIRTYAINHRRNLL